MKCFYCDKCRTMIFFENDCCTQCGERLGFFSEVMEMRTTHHGENKMAHRDCANNELHHVCNWMVPAEDNNPFCLACRLNEVIPDLSVAGNCDRWYKLELAKRRCLYTFLRLGLPVEAGQDAARPALRFRFLGDGPNLPPVLTGHEHGVITINIAEADGDERERRRLRLHEPFRTLVGHIRHESGHYYWDRLVANSPHLQKYRELFGDETTDYDGSLKKYYEKGPSSDWSKRTVTAYASLHPWEDWAETWAHYLHIVDTTETAASFGLALHHSGTAAEPKPGSLDDFDALLANWQPLTCALNSINRSMGLSDLYPFVITPPVIEKLRFVHDLIHG